MTQEAKTARMRVWRKTESGFLSSLYTMMQTRVRGSKGQPVHLYKGLKLLSREKFYAWAQAQKTFHKLFTAWVASGYDRRLTPSVDRIDSTKGYVIGNIRWLTNSQNCALGRTNPLHLSAAKVAVYKAAGVRRVQA